MNIWAVTCNYEWYDVDILIWRLIVRSTWNSDYLKNVKLVSKKFMYHVW